MTKTEYRTTRRLIRENGFYALRYMTIAQAWVWDHIRDIQKARDTLKDKVAKR
jgi:hypothetical protein